MPTTDWTALSAASSAWSYADFRSAPSVSTTTIARTVSADAFTNGIAGSLVTARSGESGAAWTRHPSFALDSGAIGVLTDEARVRPQGAVNAVIYYPSGAPASSDYTARVTLRVKSLPGNIAVGLIARSSITAETGYVLHRNEGTGVKRWELYRTIAQTSTLLGSFAQSLTTGEDYVMMLAVSGTSVRASINSVERIAVNDTAITLAGRGAFRLYTTSGVPIATDSTGFHLTNFHVEESVVSITTTYSSPTTWTPTTKPSTSWVSL